MCHVTSAFVSSYSLLAVRRRVTAVLQKYFMSGSDYKVLEDELGASMLEVEWTNQHGCGGNEDTDPHKLNCNLVFQMMCHEDSADVTGTVLAGKRCNACTSSSRCQLNVRMTSKQQL